MNKTIKTVILLSLITILAGAGCNKQTKNKQSEIKNQTSPIQIGWVGPLTGEGAGVGSDALEAAQMAVEEINSENNKTKIELIVEDAKCDSKEAVSAIQKLINIDKVPVVLGGACSGETLAMTPIAEQNKKILFSYCSTASQITKAGDYIFRSVPSDSYQGKFAAKYIYEELNKKKVAVLASIDDWGQGIRDVFIEEFKKIGGEIVILENFAPESRDLRSQLTKIKGSNPDLLYFIAHPEASMAGLKQAGELNLQFPLFGGDPWDDVELQKQNFAEGLMYSVQSKGDIREDWRKKLINRGGNATLCAPSSYDNVKIISKIIDEVGFDSEKIKEELYNLKNYQGVSGLIEFDDYGDLKDANFEVRIIKNNGSEVMK